MTTPNSLAGVFEGAAGSGATIHFVPSGAEVEIGELWSAADPISVTLSRHETIAMALTSTPECLVALFAAVRAGVTVVSLPLPQRGAPIEDYVSFVGEALDANDVEAVFVDDSLIPLLPPIGVDLTGFAHIPRGASPSVGREGFTLVQYTSGSTGTPKGIVLHESAILANVEATAERLATDPSDVVCSWLPLSHDMGLIGIFMTAMFTVADARRASGSMALIAPDHFIARPASWFSNLSERRATITAGPDFGLQRAVAASADGSLDLSSLRVLIVGAEPLRVASLRSLADGFRHSGLSERALCPAYGLAEATLAVTLTAPDQRWQHRRVPLGEGAASELVACGRPLRGHEVEIVDADATTGIGAIVVRGPSLMSGYVGADPIGDQLVTSDLGLEIEGELYVVGRRDDALSFAGRTINATIVQSVAGVEGVRLGTEVAIVDPAGSGFVVVVEPDSMDDVDGLDHVALCRAVRAAVNSAVGAAPNAVVLAERSAVARTPSGKPRRHVVAAAFAHDQLPNIHVERFR